MISLQRKFLTIGSEKWYIWNMKYRLLDPEFDEFELPQLDKSGTIYMSDEIHGPTERARKVYLPWYSTAKSVPRDPKPSVKRVKVKRPLTEYELEQKAREDRLLKCSKKFKRVKWVYRD